MGGPGMRNSSSGADRADPHRHPGQPQASVEYNVEAIHVRSLLRMVQLSANLRQRADEIAAEITNRADALIHIVGEVGLGKTTFLCGLAERLEDAGLNPVLVMPPVTHGRFGTGRTDTSRRLS